MAKASRSSTKPTDASPTLAQRLRACAEHLETFARVVPLYFTIKADGEVRHSPVECRSSAGDVLACLNHFYNAIMEIDAAVVQLGCRGLEGQRPAPHTVMTWAEWVDLQGGTDWPKPTRRVFEFGKALVRWWSRNRRQGNDADHRFYTAIDADSAEFARSAADEARAIADLLAPAGRSPGEAPSIRAPERTPLSTPGRETGPPSSTFDAPSISQGDDQPDDEGEFRVIEETFEIAYKGVRCRLGNRVSFRLVARLAQRPGTFVPVGTLMTDVWKRTVVASAVSQAAGTAREAVVKAKMPDVTITADNQTYALIVGEDARGFNQKSGRRRSAR